MEETKITSYILLDKMLRDNPALTVSLRRPNENYHVVAAINNKFHFQSQSVDFQYLILKLSVNIQRFKVNANSLQESVALAGEQSNTGADEPASSAEGLVITSF